MTHRRSEEDQERLAAALRANLARRKAQARERQENEPRQRQNGEADQRHEGESRQHQEGSALERHEPQLRPTEGAAEPRGPTAPGGPRSHDSAGFVGDKPSE
jgi:hypothetical protein